VFCELSAAFFGYAGQVLRTFAVAAEPTALYRELYDTAQAAYDAIVKVLKPGAAMADILAASAVIEQAGFTTCDDLVHGFGGGYLPPVLGSASRPAGPLPDLEIAAGMTLVVQPNVIAPDHNAGVQLGDLLVVEPNGARPLHHAPRGFIKSG
jgi:Xaa-Pro aminopeptidase